MSEQHRKRQLSHESFFRLCEEARNRREQIEKMTEIEDVALMCGQAIDKNVGGDAMAKALKLCGITLESKPSKAKSKADAAMVVCGRVAKALLSLFQKLGETPPTELLDVIEETTGQRPVVVPPQPARTISDPLKIATVNKIA